MSDEQQPPPMATPRVAAGALFFDEDDRILLVKPTYKEGWDIPGGYVEPGETPLEACRREVREEIGLDLDLSGLLIIDWAPHPEEGDKILFVFDGGVLSKQERNDLRVDGDEIERWLFVDLQSLDRYLPGRLRRRIVLAKDARVVGGCLYAEDGTLAI